MTEQEKRMLADLYKEVQKLKEDLAKCCTTEGCKCACMQQPWYATEVIDVFKQLTNEEGESYYEPKTAEELNLQDRFPETFCDGQKGILMGEDGFVFCYYSLGVAPNPNLWVIAKSYRTNR